MSVLLNVINAKNIIILVTLIAIVAGIVGYANLNGKNVAWCSLNIEQCRVARIQAVQRNIEVLDAAVEK